MDPHAAPWSTDLDWLWGSGIEGPVATLRLHVSHDDPQVAATAVERFVHGLPADDNGTRGRGGWAAIPRPERSTVTACVLDLVSGGEDVADGIEWAAQEAFDDLSRAPGVRLRWEQLPLEG